MALTSTFATEMTLGERLAKARRSLDMNQKEFAVAVGLSARTVAAYELDERQPTFEVVVRWASLAGAPVAWFAAAFGGPNQGHPLTVIEGGKASGPERRPPAQRVGQAA